MTGKGEGIRVRVAAWGLLALTVALLGGTALLTVLNGSATSTADWGTGNIVYALALCTVTFPVVGGLITMRRPGNSVGWMCLAIGVALGLTLFASEYATYALVTSPGSLPGGLLAGWFDNWSYVTFVGPLGILLPLFFPDGHLPSARWRPAVALGALAMALVIVSDATAPKPLINFPNIQNPFGVRGLEWLEIGLLLLPVSFLVSTASVVFRFRRASGDEREQIKWFAFAASLLATTFLVVVFPILHGSAARMGEDIVTFMFSGLPIAIGIAILKHRLYDIDRIINRALVYGAVSVVLGLSYYALIIVLQLIVSDSGSGQSPVVVAITTLAVATLFRPARARIQELIDRRFNRRKYDAARTIETFSTRLRDEIDLDALTAHLMRVVHETMEPRHASLWLRTVDDPTSVDASS